MNQNNSMQQNQDQQNALSLLVNAADRSEQPSQRNMNDPNQQSRSLAEALRLRGLSSETASTLEEQLLLQQQQQRQLFGGGGGAGGLGNFMAGNAFRDPNLLAQLSQQPQLASLLLQQNQGNDLRAQILAAQLRQQQQQQQQQQRSGLAGLTHADLLALAQRQQGGLGNYSNLLGNLGGQSLMGNQYGNLNLERLLNERNQLLERSQGGSAGNGQPQQQQVHVPQPMPSNLSPPGLQQAQPQQLQQPHAPPMQAPSAGIQQHQDAGAEAAIHGVNNPKEELEKAPGSVIVPCRARGMPMDHNFKTAYFVIPENVKHGEELICSYFACRNAGIKFRYCSHCKVPVAKRNFRKRHKHGGEAIKGGDDSEDENMNDGIPHHITANSHDHEEEGDDGLSSQSPDSNQHVKNVADMQRGLVRESMQNLKEKTKLAGAMNKAGATVPGKVTEERQKRWAALLTKRPSTTDGDSMSTWLMEVLAVSDLDTPLKTAEEAVTMAAQAEPPKVKKVGEGSPNSDAGYGSSVEDSQMDPEAKAADGNAEPAGFGAGIVKKKRPTDFEGVEESALDENYATGSFAEWKERKRQKKQEDSNENIETTAV